MIDTEALADLIDDARQITLPVPRTVDLEAPPPRAPIVISAATMTLLEDYELYVG